MHSRLISQIDWDLEIAAFEANLPISEMTNRAHLESIVLFNKEFTGCYHKSHHLFSASLDLLNKATARLIALDKYVVKTPPVTPQLELFKGGYIKQY